MSSIEKPTYEEGCSTALREHKPLVCWVQYESTGRELDLPECVHCYANSLPQVNPPAVLLFTYIKSYISDGTLFWIATFQHVPSAKVMRETLGLPILPAKTDIVPAVINMTHNDLRKYLIMSIDRQIDGIHQSLSWQDRHILSCMRDLFEADNTVINKLLVDVNQWNL